jgi:putative membrane protein
MSESPADQFTVNFLEEISLPKALGVILLISTIAFLFLVWLLYYKGGSDYSSNLISSLPALNALLNSASAVFLIFGYRAIRNKNYMEHMRFNLTAFLTSTLFLVSYVIYHSFHGSTPFPGQGLIRPFYFIILISHIILSALVVPMILTSFYLAFSGKIGLHRKVSKFTLPIWMYVSVTGVMIFFILRAYV